MAARNALSVAPPHAVADAERRKVTTAVAVYVGLLWSYDLLGGVEHLADPALDEEGLTLARAKEGTRARRAIGLDNDF